MKQIILLLCLLLMTVNLSSAETFSRVAAIVNQEIITTRQLDEALAKQPSAGKLDQAALQQLKMTLLNKMIDDKLIDQRIKELGLSVTDAELDMAIADVRQRNNLTEEQLAKALAAQNIDMASYREQLRTEILRYKLLGQEVNQNVLITNRDLREYFDSHISDYQIDGAVNVSYLRFAVTAYSSTDEMNKLREQAEKARAELLQGKEILSVAEKFGPAATAGNMGNVALKDLSPQMQTLLQGLKAGDVSAVIEQPQALHLFKITEESSNSDEVFARVKGQIQQKLERQKGEMLFRQWSQTLKQDAYIDIKI